MLGTERFIARNVPGYRFPTRGEQEYATVAQLIYADDTTYTPPSMRDAMTMVDLAAAANRVQGNELAVKGNVKSVWSQSYCSGADGTFHPTERIAPMTAVDGLTIPRISEAVTCLGHLIDVKVGSRKG